MKLKEVIVENEPLRLAKDNGKAKAWIEKIYDEYPQSPINADQRVIVFSPEEFAMFELMPSRMAKDAVEVKWFQAYPLRKGIGSKAMKVLQDKAQADNITLTLYPWDKGQVSQSKLIKFYKKHGYKPTSKGSKNMIWHPTNESTGSHRPVVYLDMDGVLADFFHEWAKMAGVPANSIGRHDYRSIPKASQDPTLSKMVGTDFFATLPKFPTTDQLVVFTVKVFGSYNICSSPLRNDHANSEKHKKAWIAQNLNPQPKQIIITSNKPQYATQPDGTPNILVDDRGANIRDWNAAGGIGIKYQADEDSLSVVVEGYKAAIKAIGQKNGR